MTPGGERTPGNLNREAHLVELVDRGGRAVGVLTVGEAHRAPGLLHRAFSVVLVDRSGRLLLQRRAAVKTRFPLRWANSCCGHPAPGQPLAAAANARLREELGTGPVALSEVGAFTYRAGDPATGLVEFEYDHVLVGILDTAGPRLLPDPREVAELRWVDADELRADLHADPLRYAPWLGGVLDRVTARPAAPPDGGAAADGMATGSVASGVLGRNRGPAARIRARRPGLPGTVAPDDAAERSGGR